MHKKQSIFLVEDDLNFGSVLKSFLEINGFEVVWEKDGMQASGNFMPFMHDLCVLDVMLPKMDGFTLARHIRKKDPEIAMFFLTAKSLKEDVLTGFEAGADDYITKPFDSDVFILKIKAVLKRKTFKPSSEKSSTHIGKYTFQQPQRLLVCDSDETKLSPKEASLLQLLWEERNKLISREKALLLVWGENSYFTGRSMDVFVARLRKLLRNETSVEIITIHGSGIMLKTNCESKD